MSVRLGVGKSCTMCRKVFQERRKEIKKDKSQNNKITNNLQHI
jgi:hypothetical protein